MAFVGGLVMGLTAVLELSFGGDIVVVDSDIFH